jgi:Stc1 domain
MIYASEAEGGDFHRGITVLCSLAGLKFPAGELVNAQAISVYEVAARAALEKPPQPAELSCSVCKETKPLGEFSRNNRFTRGYSYTCKSCYRKYRNPEKRRESSRLYRLRHPERIKAGNAAQKIPRDLHCKECGSTEQLHKHHPDYSKPMDVITVCQPCHEKIHHGYQ